MFNPESSIKEPIVVTTSAKNQNYAKISKFSGLQGSPQKNS